MKSIQHGARICLGSLMGKELYRIEDELGKMVVTQRGNRRILSFDSMLEQSSVLMDKPYYLMHEYSQVMLLGLLFAEARHITLLGLGGGGLAHCVNHFFPGIIVQVVELRQTVIDIAYQWFDLPRDSCLKVKHAEAAYYVSGAQSASTDIIFSDLYEANGMAECQNNLRFIENCFTILTNKGCLVLNFHELPNCQSALLKLIIKLFPLVFIHKVSTGNNILFCTKNSQTMSEEELINKAESLVKTVDMPLMLYCRQLKALHC